MKFIVIASCVILIVLIAAMLDDQPSAAPVEITSAPSVEHIQHLASLVTANVHVTDALMIKMTGRTGQLRAAVIVHGDAMISIDLTQARIEQIDHQAKTATITLPQPHVAHARLDHDRTRIFSIEATGLWSMMPTDVGRAELIDRAMREAQHAVHRAASDPNIIEQSRTRAENLICTFFDDSMTWSVTVDWIDAIDETE